MRNLTKSLLVASIMAVGASMAQAQYNPGDLLLNFRVYTGTAPQGSAGSLDYTVDIGQFSALQGQNNVTVLSGVDLSTLLNGKTRTTDDKFDNIQFSVFGGDNSGAPYSFYGTKARTGASTDPSSKGTEGGWVGQSTTTMNAYLNQLPSIAAGFVADSDAASYHTAIGNGDFNTAFQGNIENSTGTGFVAGGKGVTSDLFYATSQKVNSKYIGTYEGTFTLNTDGSVVYNETSAVPEPATFGILAAAGLLLVSVRRQFGKRA